MNRRNINKTQDLISEMKEMLYPRQDIFSLMNEGLVYGEDGEEYIGGENEMGMEEPQGMQQSQPMGGQRPQGMSKQQPMGEPLPGEQNPLDGDPEISKLITNIRVQTLQGLTKLAENPESAQYELLKKIFLLVDKAVEDKVDPDKQA